MFLKISAAVRFSAVRHARRRNQASAIGDISKRRRQGTIGVGGDTARPRRIIAASSVGAGRSIHDIYQRRVFRRSSKRRFLPGINALSARSRSRRRHVN